MTYAKFILLASLAIAHHAHACTPPKSYYKHVKCTSSAGVFLAVKDDGAPVALLDNKGNKTADLFAYQKALGSEFKSGLLPVQKNGKVGYINEHGKIVIGFEYQPMSGAAWARGVSDGRIIIKQNGGLGVIDTKGNTIVTPSTAISHISDFSKGKANVKGQSNYQIDKNGQILGQTPISTTATKPKTTVKPATTTPINPPSTHTFVAHQQDGKWGFVNDKGVAMIVYAFDEVKPYSEGLAAVRTGDQWGFIDGAGNLVIDFRFDKNGFILDTKDSPNLPEPLIFYHGKAWIGSLNNGNKLCINPQGINVACSPSVHE